MHNGLIVAALQLSDTAEGDGGLAVVSGSRPSLPLLLHTPQMPQGPERLS